MFNELIPQISKHFLYSILKNDHNTGMTIIETIAESPPEEVGEFLASFANSLITYFFQLEAGLKDYDKMRIQALKELKNLHLEDDMGELN